MVLGMIFVLLPAYNEERDIGKLLQRIKSAMDELSVSQYTVLVVNDGSTDGTLQVISGCQETIPILLLDHGVNKGLGQAMLTGLSRASELMANDDVLITMDADNTHDPCLIGTMVEKLRSGPDVVIASRYEKGGEEIGLSGFRSFLSRGASGLLSVFFPIAGAKDYTCGFRAYRGGALKQAFRAYGQGLVEERGFTCMAEILIKLRAVRVRVSEVPLVLRYDLKSGPSKMKVLRTILRYFVLIGHNLFLRSAVEIAR
jgi:dolichol-phosphate mannosyltransferase